MAHYHTVLAELRHAIWHMGGEASPALTEAFDHLSHCAVPEGIVLLPTARMAPGPHLDIQDEDARACQGIVDLARHRARRAGMLPPVIGAA